MVRRVIIGFMGLLSIAFTGSAWALHAGGVEVGDLETGSVVGQPFKELDIDAELFAIDIGNLKTWYPPVTVIDFKVRPGRPVLLRVTNSSAVQRGFQMTDAVSAATPTVLKAEVVLKPGETRYIGIPTSDLFYATQGNTLTYRDHLNPKDPGGKLVMIK